MPEQGDTDRDMRTRHYRQYTTSGWPGYTARSISGPPQEAKGFVPGVHPSGGASALHPAANRERSMWMALARCIVEVGERDGGGESTARRLALRETEVAGLHWRRQS